MKVFALIYSVGCSTGYKEFVGMYSSMEKAEDAKKKDMCNPNQVFRDERDYLIEEIVVDKNINHVFVEW